jgi:hypothetical protein
MKPQGDSIHLFDTYPIVKIERILRIRDSLKKLYFTSIYLYLEEKVSKTGLELDEEQGQSRKTKPQSEQTATMSRDPSSH